MPTLNEGIVQLEDGDELQIDENGGHILVRK